MTPKDTSRRIVYHCDVCNRDITCPCDTRFHWMWKNGELTYEEAQAKFAESHVRHNHTNYDDIVRERRKMYRRIGFKSSMAFAMAKQDARLMSVSMRQC